MNQVKWPHLLCGVVTGKRATPARVNLAGNRQQNIPRHRAVLDRSRSAPISELQEVWCLFSIALFCAFERMVHKTEAEFPPGISER